MSTSKGYWLPLEIKPADYVALGVPKVGDLVKLDYDEKSPVWSGSAVLVNSSTDTAKKQFKAPEYGASFILSANFGQ